jgi:transposase
MHLPRLDQVVATANETCPDGAGALHTINQDIAERPDAIPAQFRGRVTCWPKYACRAYQDVVAQNPAPVRLISRLFTTSSALWRP